MPVPLGIHPEADKSQDFIFRKGSSASRRTIGGVTSDGKTVMQAIAGGGATTEKATLSQAALNCDDDLVQAIGFREIATDAQGLKSLLLVWGGETGAGDDW